MRRKRPLSAHRQSLLSSVAFPVLSTAKRILYVILHPGFLPPTARTSKLPWPLRELQVWRVWSPRHLAPSHRAPGWRPHGWELPVMPMPARVTLCCLSTGTDLWQRHLCSLRCVLPPPPPHHCSSQVPRLPGCPAEFHWKYCLLLGTLLLKTSQGSWLFSR